MLKEGEGERKKKKAEEGEGEGEKEKHGRKPLKLLTTLSWRSVNNLSYLVVGVSLSPWEEEMEKELGNGTHHHSPPLSPWPYDDDTHTMCGWINASLLPLTSNIRLGRTVTPI